MSYQTHVVRVALFASAICATIAIIPARAQSVASQIPKECAVYQDAVANDNLVALPREMLKDWQTAIPCLVRIVAAMKPSVASVKDVLTRKDLLRAAKALRVILDENGQASITFFRNADNLDVVTVLTFAARSTDYDFRVNSTLVLGNVVDNSTICVPLDHLSAPDLNTNGRTNLLAIITAVGSYAVEENVDNIAKAIGEVKTGLPADFTDTKRVIQNAEDRLAKRRTASASELNPPNKEALLKDCRSYVFNWAANKFRF